MVEEEEEIFFSCGYFAGWGWQPMGGCYYFLLRTCGIDIHIFYTMSESCSERWSFPYDYRSDYKCVEKRVCAIRHILRYHTGMSTSRPIAYALDPARSIPNLPTAADAGTL